MIKAICFDLDGVYFTDKGKKAFHKALTDLSGSEEKVIHFLYKSDEMANFSSGNITENDLWDFARNYLNLNLTNQAFRDLWVKEYETDENVKSTVLKARKNGYITCICSNNNAARVEELDKKFNFLNNFDVKVFSYKIGFFKPKKEIFQELIKQSKVKPEEIVYSDDKEDRLTGAFELGINTFVYENFEQFTNELKKLGVNFD